MRRLFLSAPLPFWCGVPCRPTGGAGGGALLN
jgi:hypothetical protein